MRSTPFVDLSFAEAIERANEELAKEYRQHEHWLRLDGYKAGLEAAAKLSDAAAERHKYWAAMRSEHLVMADNVRKLKKEDPYADDL